MVLEKINIKLPGINIPCGAASLTIDVSWLVIAPAALWAIATIYIPVVGTSLTGLQVWAAAIAILGFMAISLILHTLAHSLAARIRGRYPPMRIPVYLLGDAAQAWPAGLKAGQEAAAAIAGPLVNGLLAVAAYVLWNVQVNAFLSVISFFLVIFNVGIMVLNISPAFPFDGGRIVRSLFRVLMGRPGFAGRLVCRLGYGISGGFIAWGIALIAMRRELSLQAGAAAVVLAVLILQGLAAPRGWEWNTSDLPGCLGRIRSVFSTSFISLVILVMAIAIIGFIPLDSGLEAPGFTANVDPMVQVPSEYAYSASGSFILTTVIPQAPILLIEWVYGHLNRSIKLVSPDRVVTPHTSIQSTSRQQYHLLLNSETTAVIVGLRLAGYHVESISHGVLVVSVLSESPANGLLLIGDVITNINGQSVLSPSDVTDLLKTVNPGSTLDVQVERKGTKLTLQVPVMPATEPGGPVRIGIGITPYNTSYQLPFPVHIVSQKVVGGPSAGLMFTMGVYNMLVSEDLTGGRKIAGTGTIDLNGDVGPIGGVRQKVVAAERAGAEYFLVPPGNFKDAVEVAHHIQIIKVATALDAINFLRNLQPITR